MLSADWISWAIDQPNLACAVYQRPYPSFTICMPLSHVLQQLWENQLASIDSE